MRIYEDIPDGVHRCLIRSARKDVSKAGNDVIRMVLSAYGYDAWITHYVVFLTDRPDVASRQIREIFASAPEIDGVYELRRWSGTECACDITHDEWHGKTVPKIAAFVPASAQSGLPHFTRPDGGVVVCDAVCGEA